MDALIDRFGEDVETYAYDMEHFLARNAISQAQYDKSLGDLTDKMGMSKVLEELSQAKEH